MLTGILAFIKMRAEIVEPRIIDIIGVATSVTDEGSTSTALRKRSLDVVTMYTVVIGG